MGTPHKHAEVIKAWADGAEIEYRPRGSDADAAWEAVSAPAFDDDLEFRLKPKRDWRDDLLDAIEQGHTVNLVIDGKSLRRTHAMDVLPTVGREAARKKFAGMWREAYRVEPKTVTETIEIKSGETRSVPACIGDAIVLRATVERPENTSWLVGGPAVIQITRKVHFTPTKESA